ncbi:MAG: hypothetical protein ACK40V_09530, partial [Anaerolineales bacterium]
GRPPPPPQWRGPPRAAAPGGFPHDSADGRRRRTRPCGISVKKKTLSEALRVLKPGGKLVIVDYHQPSIFNPLRYLFRPILKLLEPFALDMWKSNLESWLPQGFVPAKYIKTTFFGGLYQKIVMYK